MLQPPDVQQPATHILIYAIPSSSSSSSSPSTASPVHPPLATQPSSSPAPSASSTASSASSPPAGQPGAAHHKFRAAAAAGRSRAAPGAGASFGPGLRRSASQEWVPGSAPRLSRGAQSQVFLSGAAGGGLRDEAQVGSATVATVSPRAAALHDVGEARVAETWLYPQRRLWPMDVGRGDTVWRVKSRMAAVLAVDMVDQVLLFRGRALSDDEVLVELDGIEDGVYVVVLTMREPKRETDEAAAAAAAAAAAPSTHPPGAAPAPDDMQLLYDKIVAHVTAQPTWGAQVQQLRDMGFSRTLVVKALLLSGLQTQIALDWLILRSRDPLAQAPLRPSQVREIARYFRLTAPLPVPRAVVHAIQNRTCTYSVTRKSFVPQIYYHCHDCGLTDGRGCCVSCAQACHSGHRLSRPMHSDKFFCDCGAGDVQPCRCLRNLSDGDNAAPVDARHAVFLEHDQFAFVGVPISSVSALDELLVPYVLGRLGSTVRYYQSQRWHPREPLSPMAGSASLPRPEPFSAGDVALMQKSMDTLTTQPRHVFTLLQALSATPEAVRVLNKMLLRAILFGIQTVTKTDGVLEDESCSRACLSFFVNLSAHRQLGDAVCDMYELILCCPFVERAVSSCEFEVSRHLALQLLSNLCLLAQPSHHDMRKAILLRLFLAIECENDADMLRESILTLGSLLVRVELARADAFDMDGHIVLAHKLSAMEGKCKDWKETAQLAEDAMSLFEM